MLVFASRAADIGGQWHAEFDPQIGLQKYVFTFQSDGSKVTGKAVSEVNGQKRETELKEGTLNEDSLGFVEMFSFQGNEISIKYTGKVGADGIGIYGDRQTVIDDGVSRRLTLKKRQNIVRCAVVNGGGATDFCARFLDPNGKPLKGFTVSGGEVAR